MNQAEIRRRQAGMLSDILTLVILFVIGRLTGDNGITYGAVAFSFVSLVWAVIGGGLSDALGKLLRKRNNKGQFKNAAKLRKAAFVFQAISGLFGSLILILLARIVSEKLFGIPYSTMIIVALSPVLFLRTISAILLGYFQGDGWELPTAVAGIIRKLAIFGFVLLFTNKLSAYGEKVSSLLKQENFTAMYGGVGAALAICLAELIIIIFLALIYRGKSKTEKAIKHDGMRSTDSQMDCIRYLCGSRWPEMGIHFLALLPLAVGLFLYGKLGVAGQENLNAAIHTDYGVYFGKYLVICGVLAAGIYMVVMPVIGKIFVFIRKDDKRFAKTTFQSGVHIGMVHGIFSAMFIAVMSHQLAGLLCQESSETVIPMLHTGSLAIVFTVISAYFSRFLQIIGKKHLIITALGIANILHCIALILLLHTAKTGLLSLVYAGIIGLFVLCIVLGMFSYRQMRVQVDWMRILVVPVGAVSISGLLSMFLGKYLTPHLGYAVTLIVAFVLAVLVYWATLVLLRNFREQELDVVPGGRWIHILGQMLHIY